MSDIIDLWAIADQAVVMITELRKSCGDCRVANPIYHYKIIKDAMDSATFLI
jgi:hypothetical protein